MPPTLEALEERMRALEQEMASLWKLMTNGDEELTPAERGARILEQARRNKPAQMAAAARVFAQMGIPDDPVSPEEVQALMIASAVRPEDNLGSRGIQEMREE